MRSCCEWLQDAGNDTSLNIYIALTWITRKRRYLQQHQETGSSEQEDHFCSSIQDHQREPPPSGMDIKSARSGPRILVMTLSGYLLQQENGLPGQDGLFCSSLQDHHWTPPPSGTDSWATVSGCRVLTMTPPYLYAPVGQGTTMTGGYILQLLPKHS